MFRKFDPIMRMIIDRDNGKLNSYFMIIKSELIDLYYFNTLSATENDTEETPSVTDDTKKSSKKKEESVNG